MTTYEGVPEVCRTAYDNAFSMIEQAYLNGKKLMVCGNGGSAADAEHIVGELMKGFLLKRPVSAGLFPEGTPDPALDKLQGALPAVSLNGHPGLASALVNDTDAVLIYAQQVLGIGQSGDVLLTISTSGNARNCCLAAEVAHRKGIKVIALTGKGGGKLAALADCLIDVPEKETYLVQQQHLPLYHALCARLEERFFGGKT